MRTSGKAAVAAIFLLLHHHHDDHHQPPLVVLLVLHNSRIAAIEMAKCEFVSGLDSGEACEDEFNDLEKEFDLIPEVAVNENLKPEQMIKVFVLTPHQNTPATISVAGRVIARQYIQKV
ncbi:hypothetical protein D8674_029820 [Pyrus ussuriensis x Pyrus communis]|uniref:Uncharacterized protein n=1 Tax=Pyrus ussuriensis x Pyrus communis TaxID=2448454 RepID=A0A5N5I375_9ROSA|nr:hypothetical protein D8674_029820 [Pyrus ussuriensis x Pyrus communis]